MGQRCKQVRLSVQLPEHARAPCSRVICTRMPLRQLDVVLLFATTRTFCCQNAMLMFSTCDHDDVICCRFLMFILPTGSRTKGYKNCSHRIEGETEKRRQRKVQEEEGALRAPLSPPPSPPKPPPRSQLYSSKSLAGPWTTILPQPFPNCNNPSPAVHPTNGTKYLLCHGGTKGYGPGYFLYSAASWNGYEEKRAGGGEEKKYLLLICLPVCPYGPCARVLVCSCAYPRACVPLGLHARLGLASKPPR